MKLFSTDSFIYEGRTTCVLVYAINKEAAFKKCRKLLNKYDINIHSDDYGLSQMINGNQMIKEVLDSEQRILLSKGYPVIV